MAATLGLPPVRIRGPAIWCLATVGTIYLGCAAYEVRQDAAIAKVASAGRFRSNNVISMQDVDTVRSMIASNRGSPLKKTSPSPQPSGQPTIKSSLASLKDTWASFPEPEKLIGGIVSTNVGVFALERILPTASVYFSHVPAVSGVNYTLLTSAFGHVGLTHLALNMYGVVQFLPPVAHSSTFSSSGSHLAAFYLSSGILSGFAYHLASVWPRRLDRLVPARGASGAVMAVVGAFGMSYPDDRLGIILIPGSLPASDFLIGLALFETYGLFVGFKRLPLAHAAHLAGLAIGSAYVYFDGRRYLWQPARRWTFSLMQRFEATKI